MYPKGIRMVNDRFQGVYLLLFTYIFVNIGSVEGQISGLRSCFELHFNGVSTDGLYSIDPDGLGTGLGLMQAKCIFTKAGSPGLTSIGTNKDDGWHDTGDCAPADCRYDITYDYGWTVDNIGVLCDNIAHCSQFLGLQCKKSHIWWDDKQENYWVDRSSTIAPGWGTASFDTMGCRCKETGDCDDGEPRCNCDKNDGTWREDSGTMTFKDHLPVRRLQLGDTNNWGEDSKHRVGPLVAWGLLCSLTLVDNCDWVTCTSSSSQVCLLCNGDYGEVRGRAFRLSEDEQSCIKQCSWRDDSNACYPGSCVDFVCTCQTGFSDNHCLTIDDPPTMSYWLGTLKHSDGTTTVEAPVSQESTDTVYTKSKDFPTITIVWQSSFQPTAPLLPVYMSDADIGVILAQVWVTLKDIDIITPVPATCPGSGSGDDPNKSFVACEMDFNIDLSTAMTNDVLKYKVISVNGGNQKMFDRDENDAIVTRYYTGKEAVKELSWTFDFVKPVHCGGTDGCTETVDDMLYVGDDVTTTALVTITWNGWVDTTAGIKEYNYEVWELTGLLGAELVEDPSAGAEFSGTDISSGHMVTLPRTGVYSVILFVHDNCLPDPGNYQPSRRFILFDAGDTEVTIQAPHPLRVTSTTVNTTYVWQIQVADSGPTAVDLEWTGHFINEIHHTLGLLKPIGEYIESIGSEYDQYFGLRGFDDIPDALAVTKFRVFWDKDHVGGATITTPSMSDRSTWVDEYVNTTATYDIQLVDGDSVRFWVWATDIVNQTNEDEVLVHFDSSPPEIIDYWLVHDGETDVFVHNLIELHEMKVEFKTWDIHSGLKSIEWRLYDNFTDSEIEHGSGAVAVEQLTPDMCTASDFCECRPIGECYDTYYEFMPTFSMGTHDHDYFLTLTITSNAELFITPTIKISVDTSPPEKGAVHDGMVDTNEIDYQSELALHAHWESFFDKESGVKFYEYIYDTKCWAQDDWKTAIKMNMTRTESSFTTWTAPSTGTYFITVVAYNRAIDPSDPVCSDGVVIDNSPPSLGEIFLDNARISPGILKNANDDVFYADHQRYLYNLPNATEACRNKIPMVSSDIDIYPNAPEGNILSTHIASDVDCNNIYPVDGNMYLTTDKHLSLTWKSADDESGIFDFEVGLSSAAENPAPDLVPFRSTARHDNFVFYHPEAGQDSVFYIFVKAINKAQLFEIQVIGPVIVDTTPPEFTGVIMLDIEDDHLTARWMEGNFDDSSDPELEYYTAIGHTPEDTSTIVYQPLKLFISGPCVDQSYCAAVPLTDLDWDVHADHVYYLSIRAENTAGLAVVGTSEPYYHSVQLPNQGVVLDIDPSSTGAVTFSAKPDIDSQTSTSSLGARWYGFRHPHQEITYEFAIGSQPGNDDVTGSFLDIDSVTEYIQDGLSLTLQQTYFITIRANSNVGSVEVVSDGVIILQDEQDPVGVVVLDGIGCQNYVQDETDDMIHQDNPYIHECEEDMEYQLSSSYVQCHWIIPESLAPFITHAIWTLEEQLLDEFGVLHWSLHVERDVGPVNEYTEANLFLQTGRRYRSSLLLCHGHVCFESISTDGFIVLAHPPTIGFILVTDVAKNVDQTDVQLAFQTFTHEHIEDTYLTSDDLMDYYEWSIMDEAGGEGGVYAWRKIEAGDLSIVDGQASFTASYNKNYTQSECMYLRIRGYNKVGLSNIAQTKVFDCEDPAEHVPRIVLDSLEIVNFEENARWTIPDADYTLNKTRLSAVWPTARYPVYEWGIIEDNGAIGDVILKHPCDHEDVIRCDYTDKEFINVYDLQLLHGKLYRVCIHANATTIMHELWDNELEELIECSDGLVVDETPPIPGSVWIGQTTDDGYQISSSEVVIHWTSFVDVEEDGNSLHHSGIQHYEYALGTGSGKDDIVEFSRIPVANHVIIHDLTLQNGFKYYATVRGTDFVNLTSVATSKAVLIDRAPPKVFSNSLDVGGSILRSTTTVTAKWTGVFVDNESGVKHYEWSIGSIEGHADVMPFVRVTSEEATSDTSQDLLLQEGHSYYITVKAYDFVGLTTSVTAGAFLVEKSPPIAGYVYDGYPSEDQKDQDYQSDTTSLRAFWEGFHDPHSALTSFSWTVGLCRGCDDVISEHYLGKATDASAHDLTLKPGFTYYVTVIACNVADLCTSVTSDGILIDDSPPTRGRVRDGSPENGELDYQSSRIFLSAHWWGFSDPQSQLSHYEWWAGTSEGDDDILSITTLHLAESALTKIAENMPEDVSIFITVRAYNRAGLWSDSTSDGVKIDTSSPVIDTLPTIDDTYGVLVANTQVLRSSLRFTWKFTDAESGILWHQVSISTHHNGESYLPNASYEKIGGGETEFTFSNIALHDGSVYTIHVTGCNGARLCTESTSVPFKVDSSSPNIGAFAIVTAHSPNLQRHLAGWMSWHTDTNGDFVKLAWLGFTDSHSSISHYYVTVGSEYATSDLTMNGPVSVGHSNAASDSETNEGLIQTAMIPIDGMISGFDPIFVALWAVNGVGLPSPRLHAAFERGTSGVPTEGHLILIRGDPRCIAETCEGHCVCAPLHQLCMGGGCSDITASNLNTEIEVYDVWNLQYPDSVSSASDIDFTPTRCMLAAQWRVTNIKGLPIVRYEWSVGFHISVGNPTGVFDPAVDRVWFDSELDTHAVLMLEKDRELMVGVSYDFFVRAWYDDDTYAVFRSDGVIPDITPPKVITKLGIKVKDLDSSIDTKDVDFATRVTDISATWDDVFVDDAGAMSHYKIALGTEPGGDNIVGFENLPEYQASDVTATLNGLSLNIGVWYFISIRAYNKAGLYSTQSSDGFLVDTIVPMVGIVNDGLGLHDLEYQNSTTFVSASWHCYLDLESYIDHYMWCVGTDQDDTAEARLVACVSVGQKLNAFKHLQTPLNNGDKFFSKVYAVDAANLESSVVTSDGIIVDTTSPKPQFQTVNPENVLTNPSFEDIVEGEEALISPDDVSFDSDATPASWAVEIQSSCAVITPAGRVAQDGLSYIALKGQTSQTFTTTPGEKYRVTFYVSHMEPSNYPVLNQEGHIKICSNDDECVIQELFEIYRRPPSRAAGSTLQQGIPSISWMFHQYVFIADESSYTIALSSIGETNGILLDNVQVLHVSFASPSDSLQPMVNVGTQFVHEWSSIHAHWHFEDEQSPILEYQWAIGTVRGGTQVQSFVSVGTRTHAYNSELYLQHGSKLFVTVTARNAAELIGLAYSAPITIDTTPPTISYVYDGEVEGTDIQFQSTKTISASWMSADDESGVKECVWFVGREVESADLVDPTPSANPLSDSVQVSPNDLKETLLNGDVVYVTIRCQNNAGLTFTKSSDGVAILISGPSIQSAVLYGVNPSSTVYATRKSTQSNNDTKLASWDGFYDPLGVMKYQCKLTTTDDEPGTIWSDCGSGFDTAIKWIEMEFSDTTNYTVSIRAVNNANLVSDEIRDIFSIETVKPTYTVRENTPAILFTWLSGSNVVSCGPSEACISDVLFTWSDSFSSNTPLIYVVSLGTTEGGSDILNWVETTTPLMRARGVIYEPLFVSVTAVNTAGLYQTIQHEVPAPRTAP